jgi:ribose transport system ATP-binding protein
MHLEMRSITKRFPGVVALRDMNLHVRGGEVLALMGENGAGKSTLMKILGGAYIPDEGQLLIDGQPVQFRSVADAKRQGIALIHQELMLAPNLDITANLFLGNERTRWGALNRLDRAAMHGMARTLLQRVGLNLPPTTPVSRLSAGRMQMVEIAKALALDARALIMDEPTSSLSGGESQQLFNIVAALREQGLAIIYISHRMEEVLRLADRITVIRDGRYIGDLSRSEATHDRIVGMMVGRQLGARFPDRITQASPTSPISQPAALVVDDLIVPGAPAGVSFQARRGEIVGFAGLIGSGRTELMQVIFGVDTANGGRMLLDGKPYAPRSTRSAINRGVYLAPEDRKHQGLVLPMSIAQNISLPDIGSYRPRGWLNRRRERRVATAELARLRIKAPGIHSRAVNLSGGNQQKVVLGKWLGMRPRVLILDEPTRGIDVGAKAEIYRTMAQLAETGITILMVSSDLEEVLGVSDRVVVMRDRGVVDILPRAAATAVRVGSLMTGGPASAGDDPGLTPHQLTPEQSADSGVANPL